MPIVIGALGSVTKGLVQGLEDIEIRGRVETIETTYLLRSARIARSVLEIVETCCHSDSSERPSANVKQKKQDQLEKRQWQTFIQRKRRTEIKKILAEENEEKMIDR